MAETHLDADVVAEGIHWFAGYGPLPLAGPCPHDCDHKWGTSVIAWGYDKEHYELITCDRPDQCAGKCRGWQADFDGMGVLARLAAVRYRGALMTDRISDRQIEALHAIAGAIESAGRAYADAVQEVYRPFIEYTNRGQGAQIAAPVPAERTQSESGDSRTLGDRLRALAAGPHPDVLLVKTSEGEWLAICAEADRLDGKRARQAGTITGLRTQADRAHKAVHDTLRWVEGKERDARRASDKANEQVYQQVARMLRRAFDRAGTAETGETTT